MNGMILSVSEDLF